MLNTSVECCVPNYITVHVQYSTEQDLFAVVDGNNDNINIDAKANARVSLCRTCIARPCIISVPRVDPKISYPLGGD